MIMEIVDEEKPTGDGARSERQEPPGFTPGPWTFSRGLHCYHVASADGTFETACIMFAGGKGSSAGNARLIAAAPALYEALRLHMQWIGPPPVDRASFDSLREDAWRKGRAVLALVDGGGSEEGNEDGTNNSELS